MDDELREHLERLETAINELSGKKKDLWDRASIVTTFLSGVVIAGLVAWWTYAAGQAERHINNPVFRQRLWVSVCCSHCSI